jgi:hypothetical protein
MQAFRYKKLVYIPITKHASTSYTEFFKNTLSWQQVNTENIDWDHDHVFAHLIHPYTRHAKGTVSALYKYNLKDFILDPRFYKLLITAVFDLHSYPLSVTFPKHKLKRIDWIPLDHPTITGNQFTKKLLESHGIRTTENDFLKINESNSEKNSLYNKLIELQQNNSDLVGTLTYFYNDDVVLYYEVLNNIKIKDFDVKSWADCSWLQRIKNTQ